MKFAHRRRSTCLIERLENRQLLSVTGTEQLAQPAATSGVIFSVNSARRLFTDVIGGDPTLSRKVRYKNVSGKSVTIGAGGIIISGADASMFKIVNTITLPKGMKDGTAMNISLVFDPPSGTAAGIKTALLTVLTTGGQSKSVRLRAIAQTGIGGSNEPSLQRVFDLFQLHTNVGDSNASDYLLDLPPKTPNDEVNVQRLQKAGTGVVTFEPMAAYIVNTQPALKFGWYNPGQPNTQHELFSLSADDANSVTPIANGTTFFDPGSSTFGIYSTYPGFKNADNTVRTAYSEDALNTWDANASKRRKARFYPLKTADGSVVANAYVVAFEDFDAAVDNQDGIFIVRNVKPAASGAEIGTLPLDLGGMPTHMAFSRIGTFDSGKNTTDHRSGKLRIFNTGTAPLTVTALTTTGKFSTSGVTLPLNIAASSFADITVNFTATSNPQSNNGTLTIASNDPDEPNTVVKLGGHYSSVPEGGIEGTLPEFMSYFGFGTTIVGPGQSIATGGKVQAVGDEVLSPYWVRANTGLITVREISSFHTQGNATKVSWHQKGSTTLHTILTQDSSSAQRFYPQLLGSSNPAVASTNITGTFGFKIDSEWSDDKKNPQEQSGGNYGHHVRFYPAKDASGLLIPDTYLMTIDYGAINYDFQDDTYLISNIRPENAPASVAGLNATAGASSVFLDWEDAYDSNAGYDVFRSTQPGSGYVKIASAITDSQYTDSAAPAGDTSYYLVIAIDPNGGRSVGSSTSATLV